MLMHKYRRFENTVRKTIIHNRQCGVITKILFIAIILTVCYNDSRWDKKSGLAICPNNQAKKSNNIILL